MRRVTFVWGMDPKDRMTRTQCVPWRKTAHGGPPSGWGRMGACRQTMALWAAPLGAATSPPWAMMLRVTGARMERFRVASCGPLATTLDARRKTGKVKIDENE